MIKKPNIRFKGFSDDWEQRKLGELLSFLKDGTHGTHADADDGPLLLSAKTLRMVKYIGMKLIEEFLMMSTKKSILIFRWKVEMYF